MDVLTVVLAHHYIIVLTADFNDSVFQFPWDLSLDLATRDDYEVGGAIAHSLIT